MKRSLLIGLLLVLVAFPVSPAEARTRNCGNFDGQKWSNERLTGAGIYNVRAKNTVCSTARRVTLRAFSTASPTAKRWRYGKWDCRVLKEGVEYVQARCARSGGRVVRWESGA